MPEETNQTLKCSKCKEWKPCSEFNKDNNTKRGYQNHCRQCQKQYMVHYKKENSEWLKQYREENSEYFNQQGKEYYKNNIVKMKNKNKRYYLLNTEYFNQWGKQHRNTPFKADNKSKHLEEIKIYEPYIVDSDNDVNFQCAYCGEYFKTTKSQVNHRLRAINGNGSDGSEMRLYCSQLCKYECPIYHQKMYSKDQKHGTSREVQPELRQMVLARDNYTCQKCNKHKDDLEVGLHCHHIWPVNEDPITSADMDTCITYCKDCHEWVHMNVPGCGYGEMQCSLEDEMLV